MRRIASLSILGCFAALLGCSGGDPAATVDIRDRPGGEMGRVVINPDNFTLRYTFDCEPLTCTTECSIQEGEWFDCESPFELTQDSPEHSIREGVLRLEVRATYDEDVSVPAQVDTLVLYEFDYELDVVHGLETDGTFYFEDIYEASCSRSDCELRCHWEGEGCPDCPVDQECVIGEPFSIDLPEGVDQADLVIEACAQEFGGRSGDEHCTSADVLSFYQAPPGWQSLSAGGQHTCGILDDDRLWCWGSNTAGQAGVNSTATSISEPTRVEIQRWAKVSAGDQHTCGIATSGELFCWGEEANGRLGAASVINNRQPVLLEFHDNWLDVAAGGAHSCGIQDDGQLFCWGLNASGQLGTGDTDNASSPQSVALQPGLARWTAVTAGSDHTCALGERGNGTMAAYCWGSGGGGRLGNSQSSGIFNTPQEVGGSVQGNDVHTISAGDEHTCATLTFSGQTRTYCWGNGSSGRLGNDLTDVIPSPDRVSSVDDYQKVTSGEEHSCGVRSDGSAYCWGENIRGQLGTDGDPTLEPEAVVMPAGVTLVDIEAGPEHTCGIGSNGRMYCWGRSDQNRLSLSDGQPSSTPGLVAWPRGEHIPE